MMKSLRNRLHGLRQLTGPRLRLWLLALVSYFIFVTLTPAFATPSPRPLSPSGLSNRTATLAKAFRPAEDWLSQGKQHYDAGRLDAAVQAWEQALEQFARPKQPIAQASVLRYLAIAHQDLGNLRIAEMSIRQAWELIQSQPQTLLSAQVFNTWGIIQLSQGESEEAYATFLQAEATYRELSDRPGITLSQINQVQALIALGFYRRAEAQLLDLQQLLGLSAKAVAVPPGETLADRPQLKAEILLRLAQVWESIGNLPDAQKALDQSAVLFQQLGAPVQLASVLLLQGDLARDQQRLDDAITLYRAAQTTVESASSDFAMGQQVVLEAELKQLRSLIQTEGEDLAATQYLGNLLLDQLQQPPMNAWDIEARVNLAESLRLMNKFEPALALLDPALEQAQKLGNVRAESYVLGQQGHIYESLERWAEALDVTRQARQKSTALGADEITVNWLWQEGRLLKGEGQKTAAIAVYSQAVQLLQNLRQDLVAVNPEVRFSFRDEVEPVYRQLVELLLVEVDSLPTEIRQQQLEQARQTIEALQLAQVQNFLRQACETYAVQPIEKIDAHAAVFYPIVLGERLEVVLALPGLPLQHYGSHLSQAKQQKLFAQLRQSLNPAFPARDGLSAAHQFYRQLIRPAEAWLDQQQIKTLVFVLDDFLRDVPMAVLHDGDRYLVEKYSLALTPGLQLFDAKSLATEKLNVLAGGLSQARQGFASLPAVEQELQGIAQYAETRRANDVKAQILLDQDFTTQRLIRQNKPFNVLHLATHGQFSSTAKDTFLLTWDERLGIADLEQWLSSRADGQVRTPIEMLILSACQTAKGDRRASLGLAGLAVRSGARSTVATLWSVQDQSTAQFIDEFYGQLLDEGASRAEALRQAQLALLHSSYNHPYYWAPFVLVGNWQ